MNANAAAAATFDVIGAFLLISIEHPTVLRSAVPTPPSFIDADYSKLLTDAAKTKKP